MTGLRYYPGKIYLLLIVFLLGIHCNKENTPPVSKIEVTTTRGTVDMTSVECGGEITSNNVEDILERGVCWDTLSAPLITGKKITSGKGPGTFSTKITGLTSGRDYYIRAYAKTATNVIYGTEMKFTTLALASISAAPATAITSTSATFNGEVVTDGGAVVTERGACWNNSPNPTLSNSKAAAGSGTGAFTAEMTGLTAATVYYVRGYAITYAGTSYGNEVSFTTLGPPVISTTSISGVTQHTAISGGNITSDGGASITAKGICWGLNPLPTIADSKTSDGTGAGVFTSTMTGLDLNTKYYVRAYAVNSVGTGFGEELSFTTNGVSVPTVITTAVTNITQTSAQSGGNIISDGGSPVLQRGVSYNAVGDPNMRVTLEGSGTGIYTSQMNTLYPFTWYSVRAYATNAAGTGYGAALSFNTLQPTISAPYLKTPADNANVGCCSVNFEWQPSVYAEFYYIQISRSADFSEPTYSANIVCGGTEIPRTTGVFNGGTGGTSYCVRMDNASLNGTWYWRVQILGSGTLSPWSVVRSFTFTN